MFALDKTALHRKSDETHTGSKDNPYTKRETTHFNHLSTSSTIQQNFIEASTAHKISIKKIFTRTRHEKLLKKYINNNEETSRRETSIPTQPGKSSAKQLKICQNCCLENDTYSGYLKMYRTRNFIEASSSHKISIKKKITTTRHEKLLKNMVTMRMHLGEKP